MLIEDIISPDAVLCNAQARSKKHCLEILSELLVRSTPEIANEDIFEALIERERLGCTGLGNGVAFPHCRVGGLDDGVAALIRLSDPVDFDAQDGNPVDIVFGLMVPDELNDSHHAIISQMAALFSDSALQADLRDASKSSELYDALVRHGDEGQSLAIGSAPGS